MLCDMIILYVLKKRHVYKRKKYLYVDAEGHYIATQSPDIQVSLSLSLSL